MGILSQTVTQTADGTQIITLILDFSSQSSLTVSLGGSVQSRPVPIRTIYCDLSGTDQGLVITSQVPGDTPSLTLPGRSAGYFPCTFNSPVNVVMQFSGAAQENPVLMQMFTSVIAGPVWPSAGGFAAAVWNNPTRTVTSLAAAYSEVSGNVAVAINTVLDLRPAAGKFRNVYASATTNTISGGTFDGVTYRSSGSLTSLIINLVGGSGVGPAVKANAAQNIVFAGYDIS